MKKISALLYDVYAAPNPDQEREQLYYPRAVTYGAKMNDDELKNYLEQNTRVNSSQFVGMVEALVQEIPHQLLQNKSVHIRGMGTFFLKVGVRPRKDEHGHSYIPKFTDPHDITARDLRVEGISFRADPSWNRHVMRSKQLFERCDTRHQVPISKDKLLRYIDKKVKEQGFVTIRDVQYDLGTTNYHARKLLEELTVGPQPKLYRVRVGHSYVYKRYGQ
jgi:nucleoid DNA-binding protein